MNRWPVSGSGGSGVNDRVWVEPVPSDFGPLGQLQGVFDINAKIADSALDLGMTEQDLHRAQVARRLVDDRGFGASKGVSTVILGLEADADDPLANEAGILPRAHVPHIVVTAWEDEIVQCAATALEPSEQGLAGRLDKLELHGSFRLLLHHDRAIPNATAGNDVANADLDHIATAQLAVDREVEKRSIPQAPVLVKPEANGPNLLRFKCALCAKHASLVPRAEILESWI